MRLPLVFCSVTAMWRSSESAPPRAVARESPMVTPLMARGALCGRLNCTASCEIAESCAEPLDAPSIATATSSLCVLFHIYLRHRHVARLRIHVASPQRSFRAYRVDHTARSRVHQAESLASGTHLNPIIDGLSHRIRRKRRRRRVLQYQ